MTKAAIEALVAEAVKAALAGAEAERKAAAAVAIDTPRVRAKRSKESRPCACGCGGTTKGTWCPGHDAKNHRYAGGKNTKNDPALVLAEKARLEAMAS